MPSRSRSKATSAGKEQSPLRRADLSLPSFCLLLALLGVTVAATHWPALSSTVISFDDSQYLVDNQLVQQPSWDSVGRFFTEVLNPSTVGGYYQPLSMTSLMLDCAVGGSPENLRPLHRTSLALHVANTILIAVLLYLLFGSPWSAVLVALLFGVHPLTVEPIPWIGERKTLLAAFFTILALIAHVRYARTWPGAQTSTLVARTGSRWVWYGLSLSCYVLALLSKPTSTPLPLLLLLLDFWPLGRLGRLAVLEKLPFFAIGVVSSIVTFISQQRTGGIVYSTAHSALRPLFILTHNNVFYLWKMIWPVNLSSHYPFPSPMDLSAPMVWAGIIGTCLLLAVLAWSLRWTRAWAVSWLFFFMAILPTMGIVGVTLVIAANKYAYLPVVGLLTSLGWFLGQIWNSSPEQHVRRNRRLIAVGVVTLVAIAEIWGTRAFLAKWSDTETLYRYMLALTPNEAGLHNGLGYALGLQGRHDEAIEELSRAVALNPDLQGVHHNLGYELVQIGRTDEAIEAYRQELALGEHPGARVNLGNLLLDKGRYDDAFLQFQTVLKSHPEDYMAQNDMGLLLTRMGRPHEAIAFHREALRLGPESAMMHNNLAIALADGGQLDEALTHYQAALRLRPDFGEAHNNLANLLAAQGSLDQAVGEYQEAIRFLPNIPDIHFRLGETLRRQNRIPEAAAAFSQALELDPGNVAARQALEKVTSSGTRASP